MSFYFYDLETSGVNPRCSRIMQFAGQRVDMDFNPISEPDNYLIKLTKDILPEPEAILITGITPQQTLEDGIGEPEFLKYFYQNISTPNTVFLGFNSIRFDDEFIRFLNYRNFYDAYEWQWQGGRSKWDILDVSRMTRALRPGGINWPFAPNGKPSNKLELLASVNDLTHDNAHDALSDVNATLALAKLLKTKQPRLFEYLLNMRDKKQIEKLTIKSEPFVYTSGRYPGEHEKTTVVVTLVDHPSQKGTVFVYDLRFDPTKFAKKTAEQIAELLGKYSFREDEERLPIKQLQFNRCPAIAPLNVLDKPSQKRLKVNLEEVNKNLKALLSLSDFGGKIQKAVEINEQKRQTSLLVDTQDVDTQLYDGFFSDGDKDKMKVVRCASKNELADLHLDFADKRLDMLLFLYKARQYPESLNQDEQEKWQKYLEQKLIAGDQQSPLSKYFAKINELIESTDDPNRSTFLLEELRLYGESLIPYSD
jgi:exodeoxyribonuclease-1